MRDLVVREGNPAVVLRREQVVATEQASSLVHRQRRGPDGLCNGGRRGQRAEQQREDGQEQGEAGAPAARLRPGAAPGRRPSR